MSEKTKTEMKSQMNNNQNKRWMKNPNQKKESSLNSMAEDIFKHLNECPTAMKHIVTNCLKRRKSLSKSEKPSAKKTSPQYSNKKLVQSH